MYIFLEVELYLVVMKYAQIFFAHILLALGLHPFPFVTEMVLLRIFQEAQYGTKACEQKTGGI
jgi:hypothetical protein